MDDKEIDEAVRECVERWYGLRLYDAATPRALQHHVAALVRKVRDAEKERCMKLCNDASKQCREHSRKIDAKYGWNTEAAWTDVCATALANTAAAILAPQKEKNVARQTQYECTVCGVSITSKRFEDDGMCINCQMDDDAQALEDRDRE